MINELLCNCNLTVKFASKGGILLTAWSSMTTWIWMSWWIDPTSELRQLIALIPPSYNWDAFERERPLVMHHDDYEQEEEPDGFFPRFNEIRPQESGRHSYQHNMNDCHKLSPQTDLWIDYHNKARTHLIIDELNVFCKKQCLQNLLHFFQWPERKNANFLVGDEKGWEKMILSIKHH